MSNAKEWYTGDIVEWYKRPFPSVDVDFNMTKQYKKEDFIPKFHALQVNNIDDFVGQEHLKTIIDLEIAGCKRHNEPLRHILLYGSAGLGKTTLSKIIAKTYDKPFFEVTASGLDTVAKLVDVIEKINAIAEVGSILFIDEIHLLKREIQTHLYSLMTDNRITLSKENQVETIDVTPMTIIGATTYAGELDEAFRSRFSLPLKLNEYTSSEMQTIIKGAINRSKHEIDSGALQMLAENCRKCPRVALSLVVTASRVTEGTITEQDVSTIFRLLRVYPDGLEMAHVKILWALHTSEKGHLGLNILAKKTGEDAVSIAQEWENYLIAEGYIEIASGKGRIITTKGKDYLKDLLKKEEFKNEFRNILR